MNANRILTVSYGTFSCTLEGFDEPFSTMTSIAEYFRDLAADDRYFGAEPPTPDAEMLHRIAEREIQRRVESRVSETGIVLRQTDDAPERANLEPPVTSEAPAAPKQPNSPTGPGSFFDKLQRIRAVAARPAQVSDYVEDEQAEAFFVQTPIETAFADIDDDDAAAAMPDTAGPVEMPAPAAAEDTSGNDAPSAEATDEITEAQAYAPDDEDTFAGASVDQPMSEAADAAPDATAYDDDAAITAVLGSLGHPPVMEETDLGFAAAGANREAAVADDAEGGDDDIFAGLDDKDITVWDDFDDDWDDTADDATEAVTATSEAPVADEAEPDADAPVQPRHPVARVVKVRRATAEEARQPIEVPGISTLSVEDEAALVAELAEVQGDAGHETPDAASADPLAVETGGEPGDRIAARKDPARTAFDDVDMSESEVAIDRILEKTNTQLKSGEATRRRSAIQHLKAAVQATRADREAAGEPDTDDDPRDAYLEDLARVVRPRRPGGDGDGASRRMAPLVLVSEQRIDENVETHTEKNRGETPATRPVRPRRVTKGNLALSPDLSVIEDAVADQPAGSDEAHDQAPLIDGFRRYLADSDADGDEEMLEAAMAFVTQEVGRANVTRPQLMTLVLNASDGMGREDALRAFATLLREGRIEKVKRGQFVLGEASRFLDPDE